MGRDGESSKMSEWGCKWADRVLGVGRSGVSPEQGGRPAGRGEGGRASGVADCVNIGSWHSWLHSKQQGWVPGHTSGSHKVRENTQQS